MAHAAPEQVGDDVIVLQLASHATGDESHTRRDLAMIEIQQRYWTVVFDVIDRTLTKFLGGEATGQVNVADRTESFFLWLANEGAEKYTTYKAAPANRDRTFRQWLCRTVKNKATDYWRTLKGHEVQPPVGVGERQFDPPGNDAGPSELIMVPTEMIEDLEKRIDELKRASEFRQAIQQCLLSLRASRSEHFLAMFLAYACMLPREDIARTLAGFLRRDETPPAGTIATWQHRGLQSVQECLSSKGFHFVTQRKAEWTESFGRAIVMSFPEEVVCREEPFFERACDQR